MPIAIVGSGRSGTSMIARLLCLSGVCMGDENDMPEPSGENSKGFWEHKAFLDLNTRLLARLGGSMQNPPKLRDGWHLDPALESYYDEAHKIVSQTFCKEQPWAWKDPRTSLLIPFWRRVVPDLKFIVCVRNPVDYARSVAAWHDLGSAHAYAAWHISNLQILSETRPDERIITHYEDYFPNYRNALKPVLEFIGLPPIRQGSKTDLEAQAFVDSNLKHHNSNLDTVLKAEKLSDATRRLYVDLRTKSGDEIKRQVEHKQIFFELLHPILADSEERHQVLARNAVLSSENLEYRQILDSTTHRVASQACFLLKTLSAHRVGQSIISFLRRRLTAQPAAHSQATTATLMWSHGHRSPSTSSQQILSSHCESVEHPKANLTISPY